MLEVTLTDEQSDVAIDPHSVRTLVRSFVSWKKISCDQVSLHFVSLEVITRLHEEFFNDPTPTDCISFPIDGPNDPSPRVLGEIFVAPAYAKTYIAEHGGDLFTEISLYIIHGLLHLIGFDDIVPEQAQCMRHEEAIALKKLKLVMAK